jgi:hypothetical protein
LSGNNVFLVAEEKRFNWKNTSGVLMIKFYFVAQPDKKDSFRSAAAKVKI